MLERHSFSFRKEGDFNGVFARRFHGCGSARLIFFVRHMLQISSFGLKGSAKNDFDLPATNNSVL